MKNAGITNPWLAQMRERGSDIGAIDKVSCEENAPCECGHCGARAYYKPTIGCYKCPRCGFLRVLGDWIEGTC